MSRNWVYSITEVTSQREPISLLIINSMASFHRRLMLEVQLMLEVNSGSLMDPSPVLPGNQANLTGVLRSQRRRCWEIRPVSEGFLFFSVVLLLSRSQSRASSPHCTAPLHGEDAPVCMAALLVRDYDVRRHLFSLSAALERLGARSSFE